MQTLRPYQARASSEWQSQWAAGKRRVLVVSPTGSGKTRMGEEAVSSVSTALWLAHRNELIRDASSRMRASFGHLDVGIIGAGQAPSPYARIQVSSVQTLLRRDPSTWPAADLVVFDECHHFAADKWSQLASHYSQAKHLGLTATPERQDGRAMGDVFDVMVVAAEYSELLEQGHLCNVRAFAPKQILGNALALDPTEAWLKYSEGSPGFAFFSSVDMAYATEHNMNVAGIRAAVIEQGTDRADRDRYIDQLRNGELDCICNVYTMTEGVDVPRARVCMLTSACHHCGGFLQKAGRILRPHESKQGGILIDLVGATILHGLPTENRLYSLDGEPIKRTEIVPLRRCLPCGAMVHSSYVACPECGAPFEVQRTKQGPKIYSLELQEVFAGKDTPEGAKRAEYARLRKLQRTNGYSLYYVIKAYHELFGEHPIIHDATNQEKRAELGRLTAIQRKKGAKPGFVKVMFQKTFGHYPAGQ